MKKACRAKSDIVNLSDLVSNGQSIVAMVNQSTIELYISFEYCKRTLVIWCNPFDCLIYRTIENKWLKFELTWKRPVLWVCISTTGTRRHDHRLVSARNQSVASQCLDFHPFYSATSYQGSWFPSIRAKGMMAFPWSLFPESSGILLVSFGWYFRWNGDGCNLSINFGTFTSKSWGFESDSIALIMALYRGPCSNSLTLLLGAWRTLLVSLAHIQLILCILRYKSARYSLSKIGCFICNRIVNSGRTPQPLVFDQCA